MAENVVIGKFGRPHGVNGEVRFFQYNRESDLLTPGLVLELDDSRYERVTIDQARVANKFTILALEEISDRDEAGHLRNVEAFVPREVFPPTGDDEFYLIDVVGCAVYERDDADLREIGVVRGWLDNSTTDIMIVTGPGISGRLLVPYVDHAVETLDFDADRVILRPLSEWAPPEE